MFELEKAVDQWCDKVVEHNIWDADKVDELKDHLHCIIEDDVKAGKSEQAAFEAATSAMGYPDSTTTETKDRAQIVQGICRVLYKIEGQKMKESPMLIMQSIVWAAVMLAMSILVAKGETNNSSILFVLLMGWFASFVSLGGMKGSAKSEWACLKRKLSRKAN